MSRCPAKTLIDRSLNWIYSFLKHAQFIAVKAHQKGCPLLVDRFPLLDVIDLGPMIIRLSDR